jgi:hypothetical protein
MTNGIFALQKRIEGKYGMSGLNKRKRSLKERNNPKQLMKTSLTLPLQPFLFFFCSEIL